MSGQFGHLLARYGQTVTLHYGGDPTGVPVRAFFQPVLERREDWKQYEPTPLGLARQDRFLYLGDPDAPLDSLGTTGYLSWQGRRYQVQTAQPVYVGDTMSHWWAVVKARDDHDAA